MPPLGSCDHSRTSENDTATFYPGVYCKGIEIAGGATVDLSASSTGDYQGILFGQDENVSVTADPNRIKGGSSSTMTGALYFPNQHVEFCGSAGLPSSCIQLVALRREFSGDVEVGNDCQGTGASAIGGGGAEITTTQLE